MKESSKKSNGRKAIPIKITIDRSEPLIKEFLEICNKHIEVTQIKTGFWRFLKV